MLLLAHIYYLIFKLFAWYLFNEYLDNAYNVPGIALSNS